MTVPNQAKNDLGQDGMYFQEVKIRTAYQLMTFCLNSLLEEHAFKLLRHQLKKQRTGKWY